MTVFEHRKHKGQNISKLFLSARHVQVNGPTEEMAQNTRDSWGQLWGGGRAKQAIPAQSLIHLVTLQPEKAATSFYSGQELWQETAACHLRRRLLCLELHWKRWWAFLSLQIYFLILKSKFNTSWPYLWHYKDHTQKSWVWVTDFCNKNVIYPVHVHQHISYKLWNETKNGIMSNIVT